MKRILFFSSLSVLTYISCLFSSVTYGDDEVKRLSRQLPELNQDKDSPNNKLDQSRSSHERAIQKLRSRIKKLEELLSPGKENGLPDPFSSGPRFFDRQFSDFFDWLPHDFSSIPFGFFQDGWTFPEMGNLHQRFKDGKNLDPHKMSEQSSSLIIRKNSDQGSEEISLDIDKDGSVIAEVKIIDAEGNEEIQRYEAESLGELKNTNPELAEKLMIDDSAYAPSFDRSFPFKLRHGFPDLKERKWLKEPYSFPNRPEDSDNRKRLGVYIDPEGVDRLSREQLGLDDNIGIVVDKVVKGSFAEKIGMKPLDIIIEADGRTIKSIEDIQAVLSDLEIGDELKIVLIRKGKRENCSGKFFSRYGIRA